MSNSVVILVIGILMLVPAIAAFAGDDPDCAFYFDMSGRAKKDDFITTGKQCVTKCATLENLGAGGKYTCVWAKGKCTFVFDREDGIKQIDFSNIAMTQTILTILVFIGIAHFWVPTLAAAGYCAFYYDVDGHRKLDKYVENPAKYACIEECDKLKFSKTGDEFICKWAKGTCTMVIVRRQGVDMDWTLKGGCPSLMVVTTSGSTAPQTAVRTTTESTAASEIPTTEGGSDGSEGGGAVTEGNGGGPSEGGEQGENNGSTNVGLPMLLVSVAGVAVLFMPMAVRVVNGI